MSADSAGRRRLQRLVARRSRAADAGTATGRGPVPPLPRLAGALPVPGPARASCASPTGGSTTTCCARRWTTPSPSCAGPAATTRAGWRWGSICIGYALAHPLGGDPGPRTAVPRGRRRARGRRADRDAGGIRRPRRVSGGRDPVVAGRVRPRRPRPQRRRAARRHQREPGEPALERPDRRYGAPAIRIRCRSPKRRSMPATVGDLRSPPRVPSLRDAEVHGDARRRRSRGSYRAAPQRRRSATRPARAGTAPRSWS